MSDRTTQCNVCPEVKCVNWVLMANWPKQSKVTINSSRKTPFLFFSTHLLALLNKPLVSPQRSSAVTDTITTVTQNVTTFSIAQAILKITPSSVGSGRLDAHIKVRGST